MMFRLMIAVALAATALACALGLSVKARAHDEWMTHEQVDPTTKRACCGKGDAHRLSPDAVHVSAAGYRLDDTGEVIPFSRAQPSPDGEFWAFRWGAETQCFFAPPPSF